MTAGYSYTREDATPQFTLGMMHEEKAAPGLLGFWQYVKNEGGCSAGHVLVIDENFDATKCDSDNATDGGKAAGIAHAAFTDEFYHWVWRGCGVFEAIVTNGVAANTALTNVATAGILGTGGKLFIPELESIDLGVTDTRVTVRASGLLAFAP